MAHPTNTTADTGDAPAPGRGTAHMTDEARQAGRMYDDFRETGAPRVNLLLVGPEPVTQRAVTLVARDWDEPLLTWRAGEPFVVPAVRPSGTLVLHNVGALPPDDQLRLLAWLDHTSGRTRLISTTPRSLLPDVLGGTFIDALFYRLNTLCLKATE